jgi:hypothetical protein
MSTSLSSSTAPSPLGFFKQPRQVIVILLVMVLFGSVTLLFVRAFNKPGVNADKVVAERLAKLQTKRDAMDKQLGTYGWIDKNAGTVHVPTDRALELVLPELKAKPIRKTDVTPTPVTQGN